MRAFPEKLMNEGLKQMNAILAILIVVAAFVGSSSSNRNVTVGMLAVIGAIMLFVCAAAASASDFGPLLGVGAFIGTIAVIVAFRRRG